MKLRRPDDRGGYFTGFVSHGCHLIQTKLNIRAVIHKEEKT
jgi:hypothetical protein